MSCKQYIILEHFVSYEDSLAVINQCFPMIVKKKKKTKEKKKQTNKTKQKQKQSQMKND